MFSPIRSDPISAAHAVQPVQPVLSLAVDGIFSKEPVKPQSIMSSNNRKRGYPTIDQFHSIVERISPGTKFSKSAVEGLRETYLAYTRQVGSSLTQWDSLKEDKKIVEALHLSPIFEEYVGEAQSLLLEMIAPKPKAKRQRKRKLTAADAVEQERLLEQSKKAVKNKN